MTAAATAGQVLEAVGLTTFSLLTGKQKYNATSAPTVNDDASEGYRISSMWVDVTNDEVYRCVDDSEGAAVWIGTTLEVTDLGALATKSTIGTTDIDNGAVTATKLAAGAAVPTQTGQTGKFLKTDGTNATWATVDLSTKVDKVSGKALSANDFTTTLKNKLDGVAASANNYTHPANHAISVITGLQTALDAKVDDTQVLTDVPSGALFTDTTYSVGDGGLTQKNFTTADNTKLDGIATSANNYTHPATHPASMLTGALPAIDGSALTGIDAATVSATAPSNPAQGDLWFNSASNANTMNVYDGTDWEKLNNQHPYNIQYLVIAGGGGGGTSTNGSGGGGGGGAGGLLQGTKEISGQNALSIVIGGGGAGGVAGSGTTGTDGNNTTALGFTAIGGGGGGSNTGSGYGRSGGSGGGGGYQGYNTRSNYGTGTSGQGYRGAGVSGQSASGAGGGGSGGVGASNTGSGGGTGGSGGAKTTSTISGSSVDYAGGGMGGTGNAASGYGSGGGGRYAASGPTYAGNAGIVVLSMGTSDYSGVTTGSPAVTTSGSNTILTFTASGSYTPFQ